LYLSWWILYISLSGSSGQITVTQTPAVHTTELGKTVVMRCTASTPLTGCTPPCLSWYLQKPGEAPKLLIYRVNRLQSGTPDSVAVEQQILEKISLWPSEESRLKIQEIITVRVSMWSTVNMCSHSDKESYKNLRQSESQWLHWYSWEILQLLYNTITPGA